MVKQFPALHALYHDVHVLQILKAFFDSDHIGVVDTSYDLYLISQKFSFSHTQLLLIDQFHRNQLVSINLSAEVHCRKLTLA